VSLAENLKVMVIALDKEKFRVSLGLKQLEEDPWSTIIEKYETGMKVTCNISNITDYGLFVQIEEQIEGLVHVSEIDWTNNNPNPYKIANIGEQIEVMILDIDNAKRRVSLGMKQCLENPWVNFGKSHKDGENINGTIKSITDFGIFVELEGGIDGLIHISDVSWDTEDNIDLSIFKKSDEIETVIISIDAKKQRISLGLKQLSNDPFQEYLSKNPKNSIVKGVVDQIDERNTLILLENDIKGLLNIAEVSRDKTEDMRSVFKIKEEIESKIIGFDKKNRTIKLSIKAKEETEEREAIESFQLEEKDSISKTSLGDLLKSRFSRK
jgi:small subunit ribosomal protein S1